jgi:DNA-binding transcriptional regulator GbsR (MarR family)
MAFSLPSFSRRHYFVFSAVENFLMEFQSLRFAEIVAREICWRKIMMEKSLPKLKQDEEKKFADSKIFINPRKSREIYSHQFFEGERESCIQQTI